MLPRHEDRRPRGASDVSGDVNAWERLPFGRRDDSVLSLNIGDVAGQLNDLGDERVRLMDESGVDVQVLSLTTPGTQNLDPAEALPLARDVNDLISAAVKRRPDRFEGFATLPTASPGGAARELERLKSPAIDA